MRQVIVLILVSMLALSAEAAPKKRRVPNLPERILKVYEPAEYKGMPYRLMKPTDFDPSKTYPLVLSLHGAGGKGTDNLNSLKIWTQYLAEDGLRKKHPCFVLVPQMAKGWRISGEQHVPTTAELDALGPEWNKWKKRFAKGPKTVENGALSLSFELIDKLSTDYMIDANRVYVLGHSMGGFGSWTAIWSEPGRFAAAVPCAGGLPSWYDYARFKDVPVWAFHSADDTIVSVEYTRAIFAAAKTNGANMKYTELDGFGHGAQKPAFSFKGDAGIRGVTKCASDRCDSTQDVWDWLFAQSRKERERK